jgi:hypothetical protein
MQPLPVLHLCLQAVRDSGDTAPTVHVDIDTLTFDRVLIFLEAQALQRQLPGFAIHYLDDLQQVRSCIIHTQVKHVKRCVGSCQALPNTTWMTCSKYALS